MLVIFFFKCSLLYSSSFTTSSASFREFDARNVILFQIKNVGGKRVFRNSTLREKCSYLEFFWSVFPRIRPEYWDILYLRIRTRIRTRITPNTYTFHAMVTARPRRTQLRIIRRINRVH